MNALRALEVLKKLDPVLMYHSLLVVTTVGVVVRILVKTVELAAGKKILPLHTYCYVDLHTSLQNLLHQAEFVTISEHWRSRNTSDGLLNGRVWKNFLKWNGKPFLEEPHSFAALINVDWFQPYKHLLA